MKILKMKRNKLFVILVILMISLLPLSLFAATNFSVFAAENTQTCEEFAKLSFGDNFFTDKIIIVLTEEETRQFRKYTPKDFPELDCIAVNDLTSSTVDYVRQKLKGEKVQSQMMVNVNSFRRILSLELREKNKGHVLAAIEQLNKRSDIFSAEPNAKMEIHASPNDTKYINNEQWAISKISLQSAWDISTGTSTVKVAVLDTGIDAAHQDLTNRIFRDSPHNTTTTLHRDFTDGTSEGITVLEPTDPNGHGTHVSGIIGAQGNNGIGISGVNWDVRLVSLRVFNSSGQGNLEWTANAVNYAQSQGIPIINFSGGGSSDLVALQTAISAYDGLFVVAAGNDDNNNDASPRYPTNYTSSNIVSVGASDKNDNRSNWNGFGNLWGLFGGSKSNYGATTVDIFAPGTDIISTVPGNKYQEMSGTSMAAPVVTGVAALILSHNSNLTTAELKAAILDNATPVAVLNGLCVTGGRLNANAAIRSIGYEITNLSDNNIQIDRPCFTVNGSFSIPDTLNGRTVTQIGSAAFANQTGITSITLPNTITSIGANAFENCTNLTSISEFNNIVSIGAQAFKGCSSLTNISIPAGTTSIGAGAFAGCSNLNISVSSSNPNYSASGNILYNKTGTVINFACNISNTITIQSTITEILSFAFYDNDNLETLHIYGAPTIGLSAFENCANLTDVYCYSYTVPTLGLSAFSNDTFTLYTPYSKQSQYVTAFAGYVNTASSIPVTISFSSDGTVIDTLNTYFGANITGLTNPSKTGYNFAGWYDDIAYTGTVYTNGGLWDTTTNMTVYAKWSPQTYYIYFTGYGSENLADKEVTYDALIGTMPSVSRTGYTFYGWKNQYNEYFTSDMVWQKLSNQTVSSDLRANQYTITYNGNGGTANAQSLSVYYDSVISSFTSAYREGYTFTGWNTNADGSGQTFTAPYTYVIDDDTTLYAQYAANEYNVTFDKQGGTGGSDGVNAIYNSPMPSGTSITAPTKNGYTFLGYYRYADGLGTQYYYADMTSANIWNLSDDTTLFAYWSANQYTVTLDQQNGSGGTNSVNATYNAAMPSGTNVTAPTKTGYTFQGYYRYANGVGTQYYNSDMTSHNIWDIAGDTIIYAKWTPNVYTVVLQKEGGSGGSDSVNATYLASMPSATVPTRTGYTFQGYFLQQNGFGTKYYNSDMTSANIWNIAEGRTLYAYWQGNSYNLTFDKQGGSGGSSNAVATYGSPMPSNLVAPTKNRYVFTGYYDSVSDGTMYYDSNMTSVRNWDKTTNATLYAHWRGVYYNITYSNLTFLNQTAVVLLDNYIGNYAPTYYEYGVGLDLTRVSAFYQSSSPYSPHLRFLGWYTSMNFSTQKTSISQSSTGNVTIYAKWKYDYDNPSRSGTYTINNADPLNQTYYDQKYIGLGSNNLYQNLINIGITKLTFSFKLRSWGEGTQHVFVYSENGTQLASTTFNSTSSATVHTYQFTINLSSLGSSNYFYIRYQADTYWSWFQYKSRYWYCDYLYMEMSYVVNESDFYNPEFYWHYQDPFD